jgi:hypothetical protein
MPDEEKPKVERRVERRQRFSISHGNLIRLGLLHLMREAASQVVYSLWYYLVFRYVLRIEVEAIPFCLVMFFGRWIADSIDTALESSVKEDSRKVLISHDKNSVLFNVREDENDDGSD